MVKDDSLYIIAIVAIVALVGLVIMATGSTSTVMVAEDLPSMAEDSDSTAIAGQAYMDSSLRKYETVKEDSKSMQKEQVDISTLKQIMELDERGAVNFGGVYAVINYVELTGSMLYGDGTKLCQALGGVVTAYIDFYNLGSSTVSISGIFDSNYYYNSNKLIFHRSDNIPSWSIPSNGMATYPAMITIGDICPSSGSCDQDIFDALNEIYSNQYVSLDLHYKMELEVDGVKYNHNDIFNSLAYKIDWSGSTSDDYC